MSLFIEILLATFAVWCTWILIRSALRPRSPAEPADDPSAPVGAIVKRGPKGRAGAVAIEEPEDDNQSDYSPPRSLQALTVRPLLPFK
jgi:hypothetical protein